MEKINESIAIFTDIHSLLEPLDAVLKDIHSRGINKIYSLGDNIGVGPNPYEVMNLLEQNSVICIAGNSEEYFRLGLKPFSNYFTESKISSHNWTMSKLNKHQKNAIKLYPNSIELLISNQKMALCHFANDIRFDFFNHSTWTYQNNNENAYQQFLYTNSLEQLTDMKNKIELSQNNNQELNGYIEALKKPLFNGNMVTNYKAIIQGHVHWKITEHTDTTDYYTIRALGMAYGNDPLDTASYIIVTPTIDSYKIKEVLVKYDRDKMINSILSSDSPDYSIYKFVCLNKVKIKNR